MKTPAWIRDLNETIPNWLAQLSGEKPGRFYLCARGRTRVGQQVALGPSCFALKIAYMTGIWDALPTSEQEEWVRFVCGFQTDGSNGYGFVDQAVLLHSDPWLRRAKQLLLGRRRVGEGVVDGLINAETKQAVATLALAGAVPAWPVRRFPTDDAELPGLLTQRYDWRRPWCAGGQAAALAVFISSEAPRTVDRAKALSLRNAMIHFFRQIADPATGGWFIGSRPPSRELVNGAMKVLNALEWLDEPPPYPQRLIDSVLGYRPKSEGCDLVDAVYVLWRCKRFTDHRASDVREYLLEMMDAVRTHTKQDGAFSFYRDHNQTQYYGAPVAVRMSQSDLHGTVLLVWAIAMMGQMLDMDMHWKVQRA